MGEHTTQGPGDWQFQGMKRQLGCLKHGGQGQRGDNAVK